MHTSQLQGMSRTERLLAFGQIAAQVTATLSAPSLSSRPVDFDTGDLDRILERSVPRRAPTLAGTIGQINHDRGVALVVQNSTLSIRRNVLSKAPSRVNKGDRVVCEVAFRSGHQIITKIVSVNPGQK